MTGMKNSGQAIICLHDVARYVEHHFGNGALSLDIRRVADRLSELVSNAPKAPPIPTLSSAKHKEDIYKNTISGQTHEG